MNRRNFLKNSVFGGTSLPFMSALTGLPLSFLTNGVAHANTGQHKFCIVSVSEGGQPLNIYAPGAYVPEGTTGDHPASRIIHAGESRILGENLVEFEVNGKILNKSDLAVHGNTPFGHLGDMRAAKAYDNLPPDFLNHLTHAWYDSKTSAHTELRNVLKAQGALKTQAGNGTEELASAIAQETHTSLDTLLALPWNMGKYAVTSNDILVPTASPKGLLASLRVESNKNIPLLYNEFVNKYHKTVYKTELTGLQKAYVDNHLFSAREAEEIGGELKGLLNNDGLPIKTNNYDSDPEELFYEQYNAFRTALALFYMKICPVAVVGHRYGGDNHSDPGFVRETKEALTAIGSLDLFDKLLNEHPLLSTLKNEVTYAAIDVFGRTVNRTDGRDHRGKSTTGMLFGYHLKGTVLGGPDGDTIVSAYDSQTGVANPSGDVTRSNSLASFIKTTMSGCGITDEIVNQRVSEGVICNAIHNA